MNGQLDIDMNELFECGISFLDESNGNINQVSKLGTHTTRQSTDNLFASFATLNIDTLTFHDKYSEETSGLVWS